MSQTPLSILSDIASEAHAKIQQAHQTINPVVGVSQYMRANGIPADVMTIDCLKTNKRIILILHDEQSDQVIYQFAYRDKDPEGDYQEIPLDELNTETLCSWVVDYFANR